ncbi:hypothetical protein AYI72_22095 [Shewanella algae]|jgi:hypothetical protein|uniref:Putative phage-related protein n=1 Tax=Vibrio phage VP882 TaxID=2913982 RepID=A2I302_9CAUD|nr:MULTISPECIES: hypothetical protein [Gammaproteobacteria]YP_001039863.1 putative phage-related protein [Vibrio phage VP882]EAZ2875429.1 hypothetical protein [Salmonella enterica]EGZ6890525.1 hypothetical protein [Vibrio cholerae]ABM73416.1 putative phage-related protein [Vibrio phage VP882]EBK6743096.1 hypothetical protein [Salmonella enterica]EBM1056860.1 hypothetical protein [Salmonella enterica]|tara:strand:+ start:56 stop:319 length:264 start_codon:yes stop_codon:yes gene_type:complete
MRDVKLSAKKPGQRDDKAKALAAVVRDDLDEELKRLPVDIPASYHRRLHSMRANSLDNVPVRKFVIEALQDLFEKYERGEGEYHLQD